MDELVKLVSQKTGLSEEMAKVALETGVNYLEDKLPAPIVGQIDGVLNGARMGGDLEDLARGLGACWARISLSLASGGFLLWIAGRLN